MGLSLTDVLNQTIGVVSSTLKDPERNNTPVLEGDVVDEVTKLKQRDIVVHGSPQLSQTLIEHNLVDALHLLVYPVIVDAGKRLFDGTKARRSACDLLRRGPSATASASWYTSGPPEAAACLALRCAAQPGFGRR
jgi:dihydrofolate reductase